MNSALWRFFRRKTNWPRARPAAFSYSTIAREFDRLRAISKKRYVNEVTTLPSRGTAKSDWRMESGPQTRSEMNDGEPNDDQSGSARYSRRNYGPNAD